MGTKENNILITEFMGNVFYDDENKFYNIKEGYFLDDLEYHKSWDWLMPVVCKIESQGFNVNIKGISCTVTEVLQEEPIISWVLGNKDKKIELVHTVVVEFIKLQNNKAK